MNPQELADKFNAKIAEMDLRTAYFYDTSVSKYADYESYGGDDTLLSYKAGKALEKEFGTFVHIASNLLEAEEEGHRTYLVVLYFEKYNCYLGFEAYYNSWADMKFEEKLYPVYQSEVKKTEFRRHMDKYDKLSASDLIIVLNGKLEYLHISMHEFGSNEYKAEAKEILDKVLGPCKKIYSQRVGSESDIMRIVWYYKDHDAYIGLDGYYSSYGGTDYSSGTLREYKPVPSIEYHPV